MSAEGFEQSVDILRRTETEFQSKCAEVASLRQRLADATQELEKTKVDLRRCEIRCDGLLRDVDKRQQALDVIVKELTAKKQMIEAVSLENQRLKRDLDSASRHSVEMQGTIHARGVTNSSLSREADSPSALYMNHCFAVGCEPSMEVLRSLFNSTSIQAVETPVTYQQLSNLVDVLNSKEKVNAEGWQTFDTVELKVEHQECFHQVVEVIANLPTLTTLTLHGLGDPAATAIASALSTAENITSLSLPGLQVSDENFVAIMNVIKNREILSIQKDTPMLIVRNLDLSKCKLADNDSFHHIYGQCLEHINLSGNPTLQDAQLGEMIRECPALHRLSIGRCPKLTNHCLSAINKAFVLRELDITRCGGITHIKLDNVELLETDMQGVLSLECPQLRVLPKPITNFQCLSWVTPELTELTLHSVSLHPREFVLIADCSNLTHLSLVQCRLQGLEVFLRRMRRLSHLAIHSCKGVVDNDVMALCSTIEVLDLTDAYCVTDRALNKVIDTCLRLKELSLKRCSNVTDGAIHHMEKLEFLEYLNVLGAKKVSVLALHRLVSALPALKHVVHDSLVTPNVRVEREDDEEHERSRLNQEERTIYTKRETLGMTFAGMSPTKPSSRPSTSPRLHTPGSTAKRPDSRNGNQPEMQSPIPMPPNEGESGKADTSENAEAATAAEVEKKKEVDAATNQQEEK